MKVAKQVVFVFTVSLNEKTKQSLSLTKKQTNKNSLIKNLIYHDDTYEPLLW